MLDKIKSIFMVNPEEVKKKLESDPNQRRRKAERKASKNGHSLSPSEADKLKWQNRVLEKTRKS